MAKEKVTDAPVNSGGKDTGRATDTHYHSRPFSIAHNAGPSPWRQQAGQKNYPDARGLGGGACDEEYTGYIPGRDDD
jgi:hypothetical protein